ncbi:hypothetical protein [Pseudorhodobacter aquimaris]|uniref:hypothetical protein n=1 Tax=Pseudorhodobacter aquimaris TaxID=687412 RepID=UPI00067AA5EA|nr:hypothetical protein [Pseudorhodobacter aquimaris]
MSAPLPFARDRAAMDPVWRAERLAEARAVLADVAHHQDGLIRLAARVIASHGETAREREDACVLLVVLDARSPLRHRHRSDQDPECSS